MTTNRGRSGQILGAGFSGRGAGFGVKMTKQIKKIVVYIKTLIESDKIHINDFNIVEEMSTFVKNNHAAEEGNTDDLMMCLVIFTLSNQPFSKR